MVATNQRRPAQETLESLRLALLKVEQNLEPDQDPEALAELKRILLHRIAELEVVQAIESGDPQAAEKPNPADLVPPASATVDDPKDISIDADLSTPPTEPE